MALNKDGRIEVPPHKCTCGASCYRISPQHKEEWAKSISQDINNVIHSAQSVTHLEPFLQYEIWRIIHRAMKEWPRAESAGKV